MDKLFKAFTAEPAFCCCQPEDLLPRQSNVPAAPAVYLIFVEEGDRLLEVSGYFEHEARVPLKIGRYWHFYTGASLDWRDRVRNHLAGDCGVSTFRKSLLALEVGASAISAAGLGGPEIATDLGLSDWLAARALVLVIECDEPFEMERLLLRTEASPLNIDQRRDQPYARRLVGLREATMPRRTARHRPTAPPHNRRSTAANCSQLGLSRLIRNP